MRFDKDQLAARVGAWAPPALVGRWLSAALGGLSVALCLHRVLERRRPSDWQPALAIAPAELDALVELLLGTRPGPAAGWLTLSFDDGYADAVRYVAERAPRFPQVEFLVCVCPEKADRRAGFRWDLVEEAVRAGTPLPQAEALLDAPVSLAAENAREELRALAAAADYRLAEVEEVRAVARLPNVALADHTNCHLKATRVPLQTAREEYARSREAFTRLFGAAAHFAFPYGTPGHHFDGRHVAAQRALGGALLWSTEPRPFAPAERRPGAVLPRFPVDGRRPPLETAAWLAARATDFRLRGARHAFPV